MKRYGMATTEKERYALGLRRELLEVLGGVNRPGSFCSSGNRPVTLPGLEVENIGTIGLPLTESQAQELIGCCRQAPYGKGAETMDFLL
jgi:hypothetical protein